MTESRRATGIGGYLYGPVTGLLYSNLGANFSASLAYLVGRFFGGGLFDGDDETADSFLDRYTAPLRENGFESVLQAGTGRQRLILLGVSVVTLVLGLLLVRFLRRRRLPVSSQKGPTVAVWLCQNI